MTNIGYNCLLGSINGGLGYREKGGRRAQSGDSGKECSKVLS